MSQEARAPGDEPASLVPADNLFARLKAGAAADWEAYIGHAFVRQLGQGSLPEACFRHYLVQDYIFLKHFARAYALAVYKSEELDDMRQAAGTMDALLNEEMSLHLRYCAGWGLDEAAILATPEAEANMAYTRFVLERGLAGDLLDLLVALAPCVVGYAEIGLWLAADPETQREGNPYGDWIGTYSGADYQGVARAAIEQLERVAERRLGSGETGRWHSLQSTFDAATRLEIGFWDMGLRPPEDG